jgi:cysteine desulfurase
MSRKIHLDFNASTPICQEAVEATRPFLFEHYGNPSSLHWAGMPAKDAVEKARGQMAAILDCGPTEVVFTSGGSESNNHAIKGVFIANRGRRDHIVTTAVEHPAMIPA